VRGASSADQHIVIAILTVDKKPEHFLILFRGDVREFLAPSWVKFIEVAQSLGKPLVMRMNLNQQSSGDNWRTHK